MVGNEKPTAGAGRIPLRVLSASLLFLLASPVVAHRGLAPDQDGPEPVFRLEKLTGRAYCLYGTGGNVGFLITEKGVLVVDDQYEKIAAGIIEQIRTVTDKPIRYVINTHYHSDHTGGNRVFAPSADIIAHDRVRARLLEYPEVIRRTFPGKLEALRADIAAIEDADDPYRVSLERDVGLLQFFLDGANEFDPARAAPPVVTYDGSLKVWLDGQEVRIFHVGPGHTDGDSMVFFKDEKVLHMGDLFFHGMYPFIDALGGGSSQGYIESIEYAIGQVPADTKVIPGHGPVTDVAALRRFRDFLADLREEVKKAVASGVSRADAVRTIKMEAYPDIKPLFRTLGNDITVIYDEMETLR